MLKDLNLWNPTLERIDAIMHFICSIKTPEQERNTDGTKRVYVTTAYALMVDVQDVPLSEEKLREIFQSGNDAAEHGDRALPGGDLGESYLRATPRAPPLCRIAR